VLFGLVSGAGALCRPSFNNVGGEDALGGELELEVEETLLLGGEVFRFGIGTFEEDFGLLNGEDLFVLLSKGLPFEPEPELPVLKGLETGLLLAPKPPFSNPSRNESSSLSTNVKVVLSLIVPPKETLEDLELVEP